MTNQQLAMDWLEGTGEKPWAGMDREQIVTEVKTAQSRADADEQADLIAADPEELADHIIGILADYTN